MENPRINKILELQQDPERIYNVCIIAHVDHGKTSLTDSLLSSNSIISRKMTGKLKYLDFREDEQEREITMKSSSIALLAPLLRAPEGTKDYCLVNLIDSPGHVDFAFEVVSGLRICDGAVVVVDVVEGIASQTINLMRKAVDEDIKCVLLLNKIDRLINIINFSPEEVYYQLNNIIETANASMDIFLRARIEKMIDNDPTLSIEALEEKYEPYEYFSVKKDNVIFGSAIDGWGFRPSDMAGVYANKWKMKYEALKQYFWGDYYLNFKEKKIKTKDETGKLKNIFVQYALEPIFTVYKALKENDVEMLEKVIKALNIDVKFDPKVLKSQQKQNFVNELFYSWMPIDKVVFKVIQERLPNSKQGQRNRINVLAEDWQGFEEQRRSVETCDKNAKPIAMISKYMPTNFDRDIKFVSFGRMISGTLKPGDEIILTNYQGEKVLSRINKLFYWMGQFPVEVGSMQAGNIFGYLDDDLNSYKSGYISTEEGANFMPKATDQCLIKVRVSTERFEDMPKLIEGLKLLNRVDPVCEIFNDDKGELILAVNGEIHLERCLNDLEHKYFGKKAFVSEMLVDFKETVTQNHFSVEKKIRKKSVAKEVDIDSSDVSSEDEVEKPKQEAVSDDQNKNAVVDNKDVAKDENALDKEKQADFTKKDAAMYQKYDEQDLIDYEKEHNIYSGDEDQGDNKKNQEEDEVDEDSGEESEDFRFQLKATDFVWRKLKSQAKEISKKGKAIKVRKFDIINMIKDKRNYITVQNANKQHKVSLQVVSITPQIAEFLTQSEDLLMNAFMLNKKRNLIVFFDKFVKLLEECSLSVRTLIKHHLVGFGPKKCGPNLLVDLTIPSTSNVFITNGYEVPITEKESKYYKKLQGKFSIGCNKSLILLEHEIITGFNQAVIKGPLCQENVSGIVVVIENHEQMELNTGTDTKLKEETSLQLVSTIKEGIHKAFLGAMPRMVISHYDVTAYCNDVTQNIFCEIIKKKNGKIVDIEYQPEVSLSLIKATLPVHESFGFYSETLINTSGRVIPQLRFQGWEVLDQDPFYDINMSEVDIEDHGKDFKIRNYAKELIMKIRERKGLVTDAKLVESGDKQSTLSKTK